MPLLIATGYLRHRVASGSKLLIDLIAHLEMLERDARAYDGLQGFGARVIGHLHRGNSNTGNIGNRSAPTTMNDAGSMMLGVV